MDNLREDFKNWLVRQGISDKLINGKSSTVYEYIRQLDILSKKLYNSDDWNLLIKNATTLVFFYYAERLNIGIITTHLTSYNNI